MGNPGFNKGSDSVTDKPNVEAANNCVGMLNVMGLERELDPIGKTTSPSNEDSRLAAMGAFTHELSDWKATELGETITDVLFPIKTPDFNCNRSMTSKVLPGEPSSKNRPLCVGDCSVKLPIER